MNQDPNTLAENGASTPAERLGSPPPTGDGFLSSLTDLESRIAALKNAHEQTTARDLEFGQREAAYAAREADLMDREKALAARLVKAESELMRAQREHEEAQGRLAQAEESAKALGEREQALRETDHQRAEQAAELERRESEAQEREFDLKAQHEEIERERASVAEHARTLAEQMKRSDEEQNAAIWNNRVETMQLELGEANAARVRLETELAQQRASMEAQTNELIEANQNRGVPAVEIEKRDRAIADLNAKLAEGSAAADALRLEAEKAGVLATDLDALRKMLGESSGRAERAEAAAKAMVPRAEHDRIEKELGAARELLDHAEQAARERVSVEEVHRRDATIAGLEKALKDAEHNAADLSTQQVESRDRTIAELQARLEQVQHNSSHNAADQLRERDDRIEELESSLEDAATLGDQLRESNERAAALQTRIDEFETSTEPNEAAQREIARRDEAIALLKARLDQAVEDAQAAGVETIERPTRTDGRRRDRLRRYKSLLQQQAHKIVAAQNALQRRHADCELVLQNRARLAELAQGLARAEKRITAGKARTGAIAAVMYMAATLGILAAMSWEVAARVWPGTYIARAVLDADVGRRTAKTEDLAEWQKDQTELLNDPRLVEMAAQRMQQRGLVALGTPGELSAKIKQDMYVQSAHPGSITVELRGEGAEKTALVLDTIVTAFKSVSDQGRDERSNDIGVTIAQAAAAGAEPLMDKRLEKAGGVFGGAALAAGLAGLVIWTRLVKGKKKYEQAAAVEAAMGEVDWSTLEKSIRTHSGTKGNAKAEHAAG